MKIISGAGVLVFLGAAGLAHAAPQIPDVIVYDVGVNGGDIHDIEYYGQSSGIAAYSMATQSCNKGTGPVDWYDGSGDTRHPVIGQNMFRLKDGRFEQLGQSWLKHGFCAVNEFETFCQPCQSTSCDTLGIGCADTYWATLNDGGSGRSKRFVNATNGTHTDGTSGPTGNTTIRGRLQVKVADIDPAQNPGAEYFIEGHYVTADDHQAGNAANNASWRRVVVNSVSSVVGGGNTTREEPAIYAWQDIDHSVTILPILNLENAGIKSLYLLGFRVTQTGPGMWHYEYAVQNLTSDQSAGSFSVPVDDAVSVTNIGFHDVDYHSGDPFDLTDWSGVHASDTVSWATTPYGTNQNANALRWGTLYNWRFDANAPPVSGAVTIGLFKPGPNSSLVVTDVLVPEPSPHVPGVKHQLSGPPGSSVETQYPFTTSRPGTLGNAVAFSQSSLPLVGRQWKTTVQLDGATQTMLMISYAGADQGKRTKAGELLILPPYSTYLAAGSSHVFDIPNDPALAGAKFWSQGAALTETGWQLTNALDVSIGLLE